MVGSILDFEKRGLLDILSKMMPKEEIASEILPESTDKLRTKAYLDVTDPGHESKLRKIRTRSILTDLLANDEFLSAESPEKVTDLYNQLSHLSPRAGEQPVLMQALLRRYFAQGQVDPHDLDQLVGIEHKLKKIEEPKPATDLPTLPSTNLVQQSPRRPTQRREEAV